MPVQDRNPLASALEPTPTPGSVDPALDRLATSLLPSFTRMRELKGQGLTIDEAARARSITEGLVKIPYTIENVMNERLKGLRGPVRQAVKDILWVQRVHKDTKKPFDPSTPMTDSDDYRVTEEAIKEAEEMVRKKDLTKGLQKLASFRYRRSIGTQSKAVAEAQRLDNPEVRSSMALYDQMRGYEPDVTAEEIRKDPARARFQAALKEYARGTQFYASNQIPDLVIDKETGKVDKKKSLEKIKQGFGHFGSKQKGGATPADVEKKANDVLAKATAEYNRNLRSKTEDNGFDPYVVVSQRLGIDWKDYVTAKAISKSVPRDRLIEMAPPQGQENYRAGHQALAKRIANKYGVELPLKNEWEVDKAKVKEWLDRQTISLGHEAAVSLNQQVFLAEEEFDAQRGKAPWEVKTRNGSIDVQKVDALFKAYGLKPLEDGKELSLDKAWFGQGLPKGVPPLSSLMATKGHGREIDLPRPIEIADLDAIGIDPKSAVGAIIRDNPALSNDVLGVAGTLIQTGSAIINPFTLAAHLNEDALEDMSENRKAFTAGADALFQIGLSIVGGGPLTVGTFTKGATAWQTAKNALAIGGKAALNVMARDSILDVVDGLSAVDQYGATEAGAQLVEGLISQFNPYTIFDPNASKDEKAVAIVTQAVTVLAGGIHMAGKIRNARVQKNYVTPYLTETTKDMREKAAQMPQAFRDQAVRLYQETLQNLTAGIEQGADNAETINSLGDFAFRIAYGAVDSVGATNGWSAEALAEIQKVKFDVENFKGEAGPMKALQDAYNAARNKWQRTGLGGFFTDTANTAVNDLAMNRLKALGPVAPIQLEVPTVEVTPDQPEQPEQTVQPTMPEPQAESQVVDLNDLLERFNAGEEVVVDLDQIDEKTLDAIQTEWDKPGVDVRKLDDGRFAFQKIESPTVTAEEIGGESEPGSVPEQVKSVAKDEVQVRQASGVIQIGSEYVTQLDPNDIKVMKGVQFKEDITDAETATGTALKDIDVFDVRAGGEILVWQRNNGDLVVIHGHHRLALAKRAKKFVNVLPTKEGLESQGVEPRIRAAILRESDGWDLDAVRIKGALENLQAGTAKPLETVKALHGMGVTGEDLREHGVSLKGALARDVAGLLNFGKDDWDFIGRGKVPESVAAGIGAVPELNSPALLRGALMEAYEKMTGLRTYDDGFTYGQVFAGNAVADELLKGSTQTRIGEGDPEWEKLIKIRSATPEQYQIQRQVELQIIRDAETYKRSSKLTELPGETIDTAQRKALLDAMGGTTEAAKAKLKLVFTHDTQIKNILKEYGLAVAQGDMEINEAQAKLYPKVLESIARSERDIIGSGTGTTGGNGATGATDRPVQGQAEPTEGQGSNEQTSLEGETDLFGGEAKPERIDYSRTRFVDQLFNGIPDEALDAKGLPTALPSTAIFESIVGKFDLKPEDVSDIKELLKTWRQTLKGDPKRAARINEYLRSLENIGGGSQGTQAAVSQKPVAQEVTQTGSTNTEDKFEGIKFKDYEEIQTPTPDMLAALPKDKPQQVAQALANDIAARLKALADPGGTNHVRDYDYVLEQISGAVDMFEPYDAQRILVEAERQAGIALWELEARANPESLAAQYAETIADLQKIIETGEGEGTMMLAGLTPEQEVEFAKRMIDNLQRAGRLEMATGMDFVPQESQLFEQERIEGNSVISGRVGRMTFRFELPLREGLNKSQIAHHEAGMMEAAHQATFSITGQQFFQDLAARGTSSLIGKTVAHTDDLAVLAQNLRSNHHEFLHYWFLKDGKVVEIQTVTVRSAGVVSPIAGDTLRDAERLNAYIQAKGYDGVALSHNHPQGRSAPSSADVETTRAIAMALGGNYKGHVVTNHKEFSVIDSDGRVTRKPIKAIESDAAIPNPLLGTQIVDVQNANYDPNAIMGLASKLGPHQDAVQIIGLSGAGRVNGVGTMGTVDLGALMADPRRGKAALSKIVKNFGSAQGLVFVVDDVAKYRDSFLKQMWEQDLVFDVVDAKGGSLYAEWQQSPSRFTRGEHRLGRSSNQILSRMMAWSTHTNGDLSPRMKPMKGVVPEGAILFESGKHWAEVKGPFIVARATTEIQIAWAVKGGALNLGGGALAFPNDPWGRHTVLSMGLDYLPKATDDYNGMILRQQGVTKAVDEGLFGEEGGTEEVKMPSSQEEQLDLFESGRLPKHLVPMLDQSKMTPEQRTAANTMMDAGRPKNAIFEQARAMYGDVPLGAFHKISLPHLMHSHYIGGIPAPSLMVTRPEIVPHTPFGNIVLIMEPEGVNPERGGRYIWSDDVFSNRVGQVTDEQGVKSQLLNATIESIRLDLETLIEQDSLGRKAWILRGSIGALADRGWGEDRFSWMRNAIDSAPLKLWALKQKGIPVKDQLNLWLDMPKGEWSSLEGVDMDADSFFEFHQWLQVLADQIYGTGLDIVDDGTSRADIMARRMKALNPAWRAGEKGVANELRAFAAKELETTAEAKDHIPRLRVDDVSAPVSQKLIADSKKLIVDVQKAKRYPSQQLEYAVYKGMSAYLAHKATTAEQLHSFIKAQGIDLDMEFVERAKTIADDTWKVETQYLEAKIEGAVPLSAFKAAVVPREIATTVMPFLEKNGIKAVSTYESSNFESYNAALNRHSGLFFQDRIGLGGAEGHPDYSTLPTPKNPRIVPEPIKGEKPMQLTEFIDLMNELFEGVTTAEKLKRKSRMHGFYVPADKQKVLKGPGAWRTGIHEIAHQIDDENKVMLGFHEEFQELIEDIDPDEFLDPLALNPILAELSDDAFIQTITKAKRNAMDSRHVYVEVFAEWMASYALNPNLTKAMAPRFTKYAVGKIPESVMQKVDKLGRAARVMAGASAVDAVAAGINLSPEIMEEATLREQVAQKIKDIVEPAMVAFSKQDAEGFYKATAQDWIRMWLTTDFAAPIETLTKYGFLLHGQTRGIFEDAPKPGMLNELLAKGRQALGGLPDLPAGVPESQNPLIYLRWLPYVDMTVDTAIQTGLMNLDGSRLDVSPRRVFEHLDLSSNEAFAKDYRAMATFMVSERHMETVAKLYVKFEENAQKVQERYEALFEAAVEKAQSEASDLVDAEAEGAKKQVAKQINDKIRAVEKDNRLTKEQKDAQIAKLIKAGEKLDAKVTEQAARRRMMKLAFRIDAIRKKLAKREAMLIDRLYRGFWNNTQRLFPLADVRGDANNTFFKVVEELKKDPKQMRRIMAAANEYRKVGHWALNFLVDAGLLSAKARKAILEQNEHWFDAHREFDVEEFEANLSIVGGGSGVQQVIHKFNGSGKVLKDPMANLVSLVQTVYQMGIKNRMLDLLTSQFESARTFWGPDTELFSDVMLKVPKQVAAQRPRSIKVFKNGEETYWQIHDKTLYTALKQVGNIPGGALRRVLYWFPGLPIRFTKNAIVYSTGFAIRNKIRDVASRAILNPRKMPLLDFYRAATKAETLGLPKSEINVDYKLYGAGLGRLDVMSEERGYGEVLKKLRNELIPQNWLVAKPKKWIRTLEDIVEVAETSTRKGEFVKEYVFAREKGRSLNDSRLLAAYMARTLLVDFRKASFLTRMLNVVEPFTNPAVQGVSSTARAFQRDPWGVTRRLIYVAAVMTAIERTWAKLTDTEEEREQDNPMVRDMHWRFDISLPGGENKVLAIPKPHELGLITSLIDRGMANAGLYGEPESDAYDGFVGRAFTVISPLDQTGVGGSAKTVWNAWHNNRDDFYNTTIIPPNEFETEFPQLRAGTENATLAGKKMAAILGNDPRMWDYTIEQVWGNYGKLFTDAARAREGKLDWWKVVLSQTGIVRDDPGYGAKDVQWVMRASKNYVVGGNPLETHLNGYFDAVGAKEKEKAGKVLRAEATRLRKQAEAIIANVKGDPVKASIALKQAWNPVHTIQGAKSRMKSRVKLLERNKMPMSAMEEALGAIPESE